MNPFEQQQVSELTYDGGQGSKVARKIAVSRPDLAEPQNRVFLPLIKNPPVHSGEAQKNIFSIDKQSGLRPTAPPVPAPSAVDATESSRALTGRERIFDAWKRFNVFGYFLSNNDMVLFLERGKEIITIRQGDRLDGRFEVVKLSRNSITLKDTRSSQTAKISLADL